MLPTTSHSTWEFMKGMYDKEVLFSQIVLWWCTVFHKGVELLSIFNQLQRIHVSCSWKINYVNKNIDQQTRLQYVFNSLYCHTFALHRKRQHRLCQKNNNMNIYFWILHIQYKHVKSLVPRLKVLNLSWH